MKSGGDLAFVGDLAIQLCGNDDGDIDNDGFVVVDISKPEEPEVIGRFDCTASASDLAVVGHLVFLAVDRNGDEGLFKGPTSNTCNAGKDIYGPADTPTSTRLFKGLRIVDISDPRNPRLVKSVDVPSSGGVHTVTALPDPAGGAVLVLASAPALPNLPGQRNSWLIRVPLHDPAQVTGRPLLWGDLTGCHDVAVFLPPDRPARGVCSDVEHGSTVVDLSTLSELGGLQTDLAAASEYLAFPLVAQLPVGAHVRHQSAAFSYDGRTLVVSNESFLTMGGVGCAPTPQPDLGGLSFYDLSAPPVVVGGRPVLLPAAYQAPPPVVGGAWCTAANFNVVPTRNGSAVLVASWYAGGTSVVQFDRESVRGREVISPREVAFFAADTLDADHASMTRGSYWYRGHLWVGNQRGCFAPGVCFGGRQRGIDVLAPTPGGALDQVLRDGIPAGARVDQPLPETDMGRQTCRYEPSFSPSRTGSHRIGSYRCT